MRSGPLLIGVSESGAAGTSRTLGQPVVPAEVRGRAVGLGRAARKERPSNVRFVRGARPGHGRPSPERAGVTRRRVGAHPCVDRWRAPAPGRQLPANRRAARADAVHSATNRRGMHAPGSLRGAPAHHAAEPSTSGRTTERGRQRASRTSSSSSSAVGGSWCTSPQPGADRHRSTDQVVVAEGAREPACTGQLDVERLELQDGARERPRLGEHLERLAQDIVRDRGGVAQPDQRHGRPAGPRLGHLHQLRDERDLMHRRAPRRSPPPRRRPAAPTPRPRASATRQPRGTRPPR